MEYLWVFLENFTGFRRPYYIDEIEPVHQAAGIYSPLTGIPNSCYICCGERRDDKICPLLWTETNGGDDCGVCIRGRDSHHVSQSTKIVPPLTIV